MAAGVRAAAAGAAAGVLYERKERAASAVASALGGAAWPSRDERRGCAVLRCRRRCCSSLLVAPSPGAGVGGLALPRPPAAAVAGCGVACATPCVLTGAGDVMAPAAAAGAALARLRPALAAATSAVGASGSGAVRLPAAAAAAAADAPAAPAAALGAPCSSARCCSAAKLAPNAAGVMVAKPVGSAAAAAGVAATPAACAAGCSCCSCCASCGACCGACGHSSTPEGWRGLTASSGASSAACCAVRPKPGPSIVLSRPAVGGGHGTGEDGRMVRRWASGGWEQRFAGMSQAKQSKCRWQNAARHPKLQVITNCLPLPQRSWPAHLAVARARQQPVAAGERCAASGPLPRRPPCTARHEQRRCNQLRCTVWATSAAANVHLISRPRTSEQPPPTLTRPGARCLKQQQPQPPQPQPQQPCPPCGRCRGARARSRPPSCAPPCWRRAWKQRACARCPAQIRSLQGLQRRAGWEGGEDGWRRVGGLWQDCNTCSISS